MRTLLAALLALGLLGCGSVAPRALGHSPSKAATSLVPTEDSNGGVTTILQVLVAVDGSVKDARVDVSSGNSKADAAALREIRTWKLQPGTVNGASRDVGSVFSQLH
jgi:TonB family protein